MDIFIRNVPVQSNNKQLREILLPHLKDFEIDIFHVNKFRNKSLALVTVPDSVKAGEFLAEYANRYSRTSNTNIPKCSFYGQILQFSKSREPPEDIILRSLQKDTNDRARVNNRGQSGSAPARLELQYPYVSLFCGVWDTNNSKLSFVSHFDDRRSGRLMFGKQALALLVETATGNLKRYRVDFSYSSIQSITLGDNRSPSLTFTISEPPRIYGLAGEDLALHIILSRLLLDSRNPPTRKRLSSLGDAHNEVVGSCFVYRILLEDPVSLRRVKRLLNQGEKFPPSMLCATPVKSVTIPFYYEMTRLSQILSSTTPSLDFGVKFQLQRLAQNGYLSPGRVSELIPEVSRIVNRAGSEICVEAVRKLLKQIPFAGPDADLKAFDLDTLIELLQDNEEKFTASGSYRFDLTQQHDHIALIHKATVTPTGIILEGPEPETKNRVLRKYSLHTEFFLRVSFSDEDGDRIRFDKHASLDEIYHVRFKRFLNGGIDIAGRRFEFLGFSHSSLRDHTCWFVAPFTHNGKRTNARDIIAALGDFSSIRSPAKYAARIGQAFSETNGTVRLAKGTVQEIPDIERNNRVFSDGVGTFSEAILTKVWREYGSRGNGTPRVLQIRWAGTSL
jgi:RNA dependent RNA polymerase